MTKIFFSMITMIMAAIAFKIKFKVLNTQGPSFITVLPFPLLSSLHNPQKHVSLHSTALNPSQ